VKAEGCTINIHILTKTMVEKQHKQFMIQDGVLKIK
jgi:hypothetical protein